MSVNRQVERGHTKRVVVKWRGIAFLLPAAAGWDLSERAALGLASGANNPRHTGVLKGGMSGPEIHDSTYKRRLIASGNLVAATIRCIITTASTCCVIHEDMCP